MANFRGEEGSVSFDNGSGSVTAVAATTSWSLDLVKDGKGKIHISDLMNLDLIGNEIKVGQHCFGCTAGQGSSCSGALKN